VQQRLAPPAGAAPLERNRRPTPSQPLADYAAARPLASAFASARFSRCCCGTSKSKS
jgi:hypothetical protein